MSFLKVSFKWTEMQELSHVLLQEDLNGAKYSELLMTTKRNELFWHSLDKNATFIFIEQNLMFLRYGYNSLDTAWHFWSRIELIYANLAGIIWCLKEVI